MNNIINNKQIENALRNARANVEAEGVDVSPESTNICRRLLIGDISDDEAKALIMDLYGLKIDKEVK